jgi:hypothetical protein
MDRQETHKLHSDFSYQMKVIHGISRFLQLNYYFNKSTGGDLHTMETEVKHQSRSLCKELGQIFFFLIYVGCPGQLTRTTTIPHGPLDILQAQEQVKHRRGDRRAHKGSNPKRGRNKSHDWPQQLDPECGGCPHELVCKIVTFLVLGLWLLNLPKEEKDTKKNTRESYFEIINYYYYYYLKYIKIPWHFRI